MNNKIESSAGMQEFSPGFIKVLVGLTIATFVLIFTTQLVSRDGYESFHMDYLGISPYPYVMAGGITLGQGISEFLGEQPKRVRIREHLFGLVSLLILYVVAPLLLLLGWRKTKSEKISAEAPEQRRLTSGTIAFVLGIILSSPFIMSPMITYIQRDVSRSMHKDQDVSYAKDMVTGSVLNATSHTYQYFILPKLHGGGSGSFEGYKLPDSLRATRFSVNAIASISRYKIVITGESKDYPKAIVNYSIDSSGFARFGSYSGKFE
jgi:Sec-independent protein secretion pathway component TatC